MGKVYCLEFSDTLGNPRNRRGQAKYYLGFCEDGNVERRLEEHRKGQGASITRAAVQRGMKLSVVFTMPGDRKVERWLKNKKATPRIVQRYRDTGYLPIPNFS